VLDDGTEGIDRIEPEPPRAVDERSDLDHRVALVTVGLTAHLGDPSVEAGVQRCR
jgi:hypothetical protein